MQPLGLTSEEVAALQARGRVEVELGLDRPPAVGTVWKVYGTELVVRSVGVREEPVPGVDWDGRPNAPRRWTMLAVGAP